MKKILLLPFFTLMLLMASINASGQSQLTNLPTLWITTKDNASISSKEKWITGQLSTLTNESIGVYNGEIEIRGRGNSTWGMAKKPYRMRLKEKFSMLGLPAKERNWVLLANYADKSLLRNAITFEMSQFIGMPFSCHYRLVDVYINGQYQGNYTLTDHVQVADTRIQVEGLDADDTSLPKISGGYLLEIDGFAQGEPVYFHTRKQNIPITIKHPDEEEINTQQRTYIKNHIDSFEEVLFSDSYRDPVNGYSRFVDMNSLVNWYIACELSANPDAYWSTYLVKRRNDEKIYFGPLWDFDIAYHNDFRINKSLYRNMSEVGFGYKSWIQRLLTDDTFRTAVRNRWNELKSQGMKEHVLQKLDLRINEINESQARNFERWNILNTVVYNEPEVRGSYANEVNFLRNFISQRFDWLNQEINGPDTDFFYKITQRSTGKALTNHNNKTVQRTFSDTDTQQWQLVCRDNSTCQVISKSTGLALQGFPSGSSQLELKEIDPSHPGQQWMLSQSDQGNVFRLTNRYGFSMDNQSGSGSENNPVIQFTKTVNHSPQEWIFTKTDNVNLQDCDADFTVSASKTSATCNETVTLSAHCSGGNCDGYNYNWSGNGVNAGNPVTTITHAINGNFVYTLTADKEGCRKTTKTISINVTGCSQSPGSSLFSQCREAESAQGTGGISDDVNASGGKTRGNKDQPDYYADYTVQNIPADGMYELTLRYSAERTAEITVSANGNSLQPVALVPTYSWNIVFTETSLNLFLKKGDNVIRIRSSGINSVRQDKICIEGNVNTEIPVDPGEPQQPEPACNFNLTASSDKSQVTCNETVRLTAACSGADCGDVSYQWTGNNQQVNGNVANVSHSQNGTYTYTATAKKTGCENKTKTVSFQVTGCSSGGTPVSFSQCIEAESSEGSGPVTDDPNASGGRTRGNPDQPNHYVDYQISNVPADGTFKLKLRYSSNGASSVRILVNGTEQIVNLSPTYSWNIVFNETTVNINLKSGNNTVRIQGNTGYSTRQDKICIEGTVNGNNPEPEPVTCNFNITLTAEKTTLTCNETVQLKVNCLGGDCDQVSYRWQDNGSSTTVDTIHVSNTQNGTYAYKVAASKNGCNPIEKNITFTVSGCDDTTPPEPPIGFSTCLESENAGGDGTVTEDPNASGGKTRGTTGSPGHYVDYQLSNVPADGLYQVTLRYSAEQPAQVRASVNGTEKMISLSPTYSWNIVFNEVKFTVALKKGNNTLRIQGTGNASTRQDKICVVNDPQNSSARILSEEVSGVNKSDATAEVHALIISPNPARSYIDASFVLLYGENATLLIHDMYGQSVYQQKVTGTGMLQKETVHFSDPKPGVYILKLYNDRQSQVRKVILMP